MSATRNFEDFRRFFIAFFEIKDRMWAFALPQPLPHEQGDRSQAMLLLEDDAGKRREFLRCSQFPGSQALGKFLTDFDKPLAGWNVLPLDNVKRELSSCPWRIMCLRDGNARRCAGVQEMQVWISVEPYVSYHRTDVPVR
jgi:hypothetical protein